jgi:hypothetical protein
MYIYLAKFGMLRIFGNLEESIRKFYPESHRLLVTAYSYLSRHREGVYNDYKGSGSSEELGKIADEYLEAHGKRDEMDVVILTHSDDSYGNLPPEIVSQSRSLYLDHCRQLARPFRRSLVYTIKNSTVFIPHLHSEVVVEALRFLVRDVTDAKVRTSPEDFKVKLREHLEKEKET